MVHGGWWVQKCTVVRCGGAWRCVEVTGGALWYMMVMAVCMVVHGCIVVGAWWGAWWCMVLRDRVMVRAWCLMLNGGRWCMVASAWWCMVAHGGAEFVTIGIRTTTSPHTLHPPTIVNAKEVMLSRTMWHVQNKPTSSAACKKVLEIERTRGHKKRIFPSVASSELKTCLGA